MCKTYETGGKAPLLWNEHCSKYNSLKAGRSFGASLVQAGRSFFQNERASLKKAKLF